MGGGTLYTGGEGGGGQFEGGDINILTYICTFKRYIMPE